MRIEESIISNLLFTENYVRKVLPFLKIEYFNDKVEQVLVEEISAFFNKHDSMATKEILRIQCENRTDLSEDQIKQANRFIDELEDHKTNFDWLVEKSEDFCKKRALYNAIHQSILIIEGKDQKLKEEAIPGVLQDALAVSFDVSIGHDYFNDAELRYDSYMNEDGRLALDLELFNKIMKGGLPQKSLIVVAAESGGGKSLWMTHCASSLLKTGKNVLYISMEMGDFKISERVDANTLKVDINAISSLGKEEFMRRIDYLRSKTSGRLVVKEYPPQTASAAHFRGLIEELKIKQNFVPDAIIVDYLGICASSRLRLGGSVNTYSYLKSVAEELRALGVEYNCPVITGAQLNRGGFGSTDVDATNLADSMGIFMTADLMFALIRSEEMDANQQILVKQLKNRYNDPNYYKRFVVGLDRSKMLFFDLEPSAQRDLSDAGHTNATPITPGRRTPAGLDALNF